MSQSENVFLALFCAEMLIKIVALGRGLHSSTFSAQLNLSNFYWGRIHCRWVASGQSISDETGSC